MNQAELSSIVMLILTPLLAYLGFSEATNNILIGVITGLIMLGVAIWNEKHNSEYFSGEPVRDGTPCEEHPLEDTDSVMDK